MIKRSIIAVCKGRIVATRDLMNFNELSRPLVHTEGLSQTLNVNGGI